MQLTDMNVSDHDSDDPPDGYDPSPRVFLTGAQCTALGVDTPPRAGTVVTLTARALVMSSTESLDSDGDDPDVNLSLKLTHVGIGKTQDGEKASKTLYGDTDNDGD